MPISVWVSWWKAGFETAQDLELGAAEERLPWRVRWDHCGSNGLRMAGTPQRAGDVARRTVRSDGREQVCVFVAVDVGEGRGRRVAAGWICAMGFAREVLGGGPGVAQGGLGEIDYGRPEGFAVWRRAAKGWSSGC